MSNNSGNRIGRWLLDPDDIKGLSSTQIKNKYSLPELPTRIGEVKVPAGTRLRTGIAGPQPSWNAKGGGVQFELKEGIRDTVFETTLSLD